MKQKPFHGESFYLTGTPFIGYLSLLLLHLRLHLLSGRSSQVISVWPPGKSRRWWNLCERLLDIQIFNRIFIRCPRNQAHKEFFLFPFSFFFPFFLCRWPLGERKIWKKKRKRRENKKTDDFQHSLCLVSQGITARLKCYSETKWGKCWMVMKLIISDGLFICVLESSEPLEFWKMKEFCSLLPSTQKTIERYYNSLLFQH